MSDELLPADVREFLLRNIDSVAQLEALILLHTSPQYDWSIADLARRLYVDEDEASHILNSLVSSGLATKDVAAYKYCTSDNEQQALVDNVVRTYSNYLVPVTKLIHDKATGIRKFADAFRFRKER